MWCLITPSSGRSAPKFNQRFFVIINVLSAKFGSILLNGTRDIKDQT